jgi:hypothetical protein
MQKELTDIKAALKGHNIILTATDADGEESTVSVPCEDIHELYNCSCPRWMEENGDRESSLWELFNVIAGISLSD